MYKSIFDINSISDVLIRKCAVLINPVYIYIYIYIYYVCVDVLMPKINDFEDGIEHLDSAFTASDCKIESKISDLIDKKLKKRLIILKKKNLGRII